MEKLAYTPREALQGPLKGLVGRGLLYEMLRTGAIPSWRAGKKYIISAAHLTRLIDGEV